MTLDYSRWTRGLAAGATCVCLCQALPQANVPLYTDHLVNGFQDWGWGTRNLGNSTPVHSGTHSVSLSGTAWNVALSLNHSGFNTSPYTNLSFWASGGAAGGQVLHLYAHVNGADTSGINLPALPTNAWQQFVVPLSSLGAESKTNLERVTLQLTSNGTTNTFFLDDIQINSKPAPALVHISLNAAQALRQADARWFGFNTAIWDTNFDKPQTISLLNEAGALALRCPGGSLSDEYHWSTDKSLTNTWQWGTSFANLVHVATNIGAQVFTTANYGTGTSNEAAAWVAYANGSAKSSQPLGVDQFGVNWQTVGYWAGLRGAAPLTTDDGKNFLRISRAAPLGFQYWEIGNECYGGWETDSNSPAHDPFTYANRAAGYLQLMKTVDPAIQVGVVVTAGEGSYSNNAAHFAVNPRTGQTNYGWTPILLTTLRNLGITPDFVVHHVYPEYTGQESDALLLQSASSWPHDAADLRQQVNDYIGTDGTNMELVCTENNSNSGAQGRQSTSLVNGLYYADSLGQLTKTEFNAFIWWDLRNGSDGSGSFDPTIYGWRTNGDLGIIGGLTTRYPPFYAAKIMQSFARPGDAILGATSDYLLLSAYASRHANGSVALLVLNKDTTTNFNAQMSISGFSPGTAATLCSYGISQDQAARTNGPPTAQDISTNTISGLGTNFNHSFPALSLTLITFAPAAPSLTVPPVAAQPAGAFVFQLLGQSGVRYLVQISSDLTSWSTVSTNTLSGPTLNFTNPVPSGSMQQFWRAVWTP